MGIAVPLLPPTGHITVAREDGINILRMAGEIDVDSVAAYEARPRSADGSVIHAVDLSDVTFLSSSGIGFLLRHTRAARKEGKMPVLQKASRPAGQVLALAGVADLFRRPA